MTRTCPCCSVEQDKSMFVQKAMPNAEVCKSCRARASRKLYNDKNPQLAKQQAALGKSKWKASNPEKVKAYRKTSYERNPQAWKVSARKREFDEAQRTPEWGLELTNLVFEEAVDLRLKRGLVTGFAWEIDHEIPLRGKQVSGLHVWNNLRVIPQTLNRRKYNTYDIV